MEERYDVYFAGGVLAGHDPEQVRERLATLFNADQKTLDLLFSGKLRLVKRGCDKATAQKYKNAMERAGAAPVIRRSSAQAGATGKPATPSTAAEKIAALAAKPDDTRYRGTTAQEPPAVEAPETGGIRLAPAGTAVLREEERTAPEIREIDTSGLRVDTTASRLSEARERPPLILDTSHLSLAQTGALIPNLPASATPLSPDTDGIALSAPGTDFSDCAPPEPPPLDLDLSGLSVGAPGSELLEEHYRKRPVSTAPSTDHLSLEDGV